MFQRNFMRGGGEPLFSQFSHDSGLDSSSGNVVFDINIGIFIETRINLGYT